MIRRALRTAIYGIVGLVLTAGLAGRATAGTRDGSWELGPYLGYVFFDSDAGIDDDFGFGVRAGYFFTKTHEIEFDYLTIGGEGDLGGDVDVTTWTLGYAYNWTDNADRVPFLAFAFGSTNTDAGSVDEDDSTFAVGGGVRFFTNDNFAVRLGGSIVRVDSDPDASNNWQFDAGVSWILGGKK